MNLFKINFYDKPTWSSKILSRNDEEPNHKTRENKDCNHVHCLPLECFVYSSKIWFFLSQFRLCWWCLVWVSIWGGRRGLVIVEPVPPLMLLTDLTNCLVQNPGSSSYSSHRLIFIMLLLIHIVDDTYKMTYKDDTLSYSGLHHCYWVTMPDTHCTGWWGQLRSLLNHRLIKNINTNANADVK